MAATSESVHVKSIYKGQARHFHIDIDVLSYCTLESHLHEVHENLSNIRVFFQDDEGDQCPLYDDVSLSIALRLTPHTLKLYIVKNETPSWFSRNISEPISQYLSKKRARKSWVDANANILLTLVSSGGRAVTDAYLAARAAVERNCDEERLQNASRSIRRQFRRRTRTYVKKKNVDRLVSNIKGILWSYQLATESVEKCATLIRRILADSDAKQYLHDLRYPLRYSWFTSICRCFKWIPRPRNERFVVAESVQ